MVGVVGWLGKGEGADLFMSDEGAMVDFLVVLASFDSGEGLLFTVMFSFIFLSGDRIIGVSFEVVFRFGNWFKMYPYSGSS